MVETAVYKHVASFYQNAPSVQVGYYRKAKENQKEVDVVVSLPRGVVLCEVKYRGNASLSGTDAIIALSSEAGSSVTHAFVATKGVADYGVDSHPTLVPVFRVPALVLTYLLGWAEAMGGMVP